MKNLSKKTCNITVCLEDSLLKKIDDRAQLWYMHRDDLVNYIVEEFEMDMDDYKVFIKGLNYNTIFNSFSNLFKNPPARSFITFKVDNETFTKIVELKERFDLNKSTVLKHILVKYIKAI